MNRAVSSSSSVASAFPLEEEADDAAQNLLASSAKKRHDSNSTQPHALLSNPPQSATASTQSSTPGTLMPRRSRTPSVAYTTTLSVAVTPKRRRKDVASTSQQQQQQHHENASDRIYTERRKRNRRASQASLSSATPDSPEPFVSHAPFSLSTATTMMTSTPQLPAYTPTSPPPPPAQHSPRLVSLLPMSSVAVSTGVFEVMLNHARVSVERQYPFLNVTSLFTAHAAPGAEASGLSSDLVPPLHRYGNRPILLLDYTGMLHLRHERRALRKAIKAKIGQLLAERADQIRSGRAWRMRRLRALRNNTAAFVTTAGRNLHDGQSGTGEAYARDIGVHYEGVTHTVADMERLIKATGARRVAISRELQELREQLTHIARAKHYGEATREGCVLMLPSPDTQEVRLCSGHHYRTVCFVGEELMDIVPGEGPAPPPRRSPSPETQPDHHRHFHRQSVGTPSQLEANTATRSTTPQPTPSWVNAEWLGYTIFQRLQQARKQPQRCGGNVGGATCAGDGHRVDSSSSINAYLALPACEAAMYREWATQKYGLTQP